jgi:cytochrome c
MLKQMLLCLGIATVAVLSVGALRPAAGSPPVPPPSDPCWKPAASVPLTGATCAPLRPPQISCYVPREIEGQLTQPNLNVRQRAADLFSWQEFIAINWPAMRTERGKPDLSKSLGAPGPRVWETWKDISEVFLPGGVRPSGWNTWPTLPQTCASSGAQKLLVRDEKIDDVLDATVQAAAATGALPATLTDQRGKLVRYEIRMNQVAFDYVVNAGFYNGTIQARATEVSFPPGSILVKASWRPVSPAEKDAFHSIQACVCDQGAGGAPTNCRPEQMGLVGLHITQKTPAAPQWIWSTFEQENNVDGLHGLNPSFYDADCTECPRNQQTRPGTPNQVTRVIPIPSSNPDCSARGETVDNVVQLNQDLSAALARAGSVFQRYQLVNTQWPLVPPGARTPSTVFDVRPTYLSNSTQETFVQATSTCMGCHSFARTVNPETFVSSDFSFSLNNATPVPSDTQVLPAPSSPKTAWDRQNWTAILRGYELAGRTYEELGHSGQVNAQLHCGSCHLNEGRNPDAAWWVGMGRHYATAGLLAARINGCFERSMNGLALCNTLTDGGMGGCARSPDMNAFLAYMSWLDEQWSGGSFSIPWNGLHPPDGGFRGQDGGVPVNGYPPINADAGPGTPDAGALVFRQKCAVCHGENGQGRYEYGYYRPALWGQSSFNACAGMASTSHSAPFLHANMPLGSGGLLTDREAWDVASFLDSRCRPGMADAGAGHCVDAPSWPSPTCTDGKPTPAAQGAPVRRWK